MSDNKPQGVYEFPLTDRTARKIINDLANNHTNRIRWSNHVKSRMLERGVSSAQIMILLKVSILYLERVLTRKQMEIGNLI